MFNGHTDKQMKKNLPKYFCLPFPQIPKMVENVKTLEKWDPETVETNIYSKTSAVSYF